MSKFLWTMMVVGIVLLPVSGNAAEPVKIRLNYTTVADDVLYLMKDRPEILKNHGKVYTVEWFFFPGAGPEIIKAMLAERIDGGTTDIFSFARGIVKGGLDIKIVAQVMGERPGFFSSTWAALKKSNIASVKDLKGKVVAVRGYGDVTDAILQRLLRNAGLDPATDVKRVELPFPVAADALEKGRVDVALFPQPFYMLAHKKMEMVDVMKFSEVLPRHELLAFAFRTKFYNDHPDVVKAFLEDYVLARHFITEKRAEAIESTARVTKLPKPMIEPYLFTKDDYYRHPDSLPEVKVFQENFDFMFEEKVIERRIDASATVDLKYHPGR